VVEALRIFFIHFPVAEDAGKMSGFETLHHQYETQALNSSNKSSLKQVVLRGSVGHIWW